MAPSTDDPRNAFESFRRFADEQVMFLMRNITGNPAINRKGTASESSESDEDLPWVIRVMSDDYRRRYRETFSKSEGIPLSEKAPTEKIAARQEEQLRCPYRPVDQAVPSPQRESEFGQKRTVDSSNSGFSRDKSTMFGQEDSFESDDASTWPLRCLYTSAYSPLYLEQQFPCRDQEERWRHAFEDLIAVQNGMEMASHHLPQSQMCPNHWIGSLILRGILRPPPPDEDALRALETPYADASPPGIGLGIIDLLRAQCAEQMLRELCEQSDEDNTGINEVSAMMCPGISRLIQGHQQNEEQPDPSEESDGKYEGHKIPIASNLVGGVMRLLHAPKRGERLRERREEAEEVEDLEEDDDDDGMCDFDAEDDEDEDDDDDDDKDEYEDKEEAATELDLYERMLGLCDGLTGKGRIQQTASRAFKQESSFTESSSSTTQSSDGKPSIISTLTTTERITHPDGSVHTKMVLRKRFADGREESTETSHTTKGQQAKPMQRIPPKPEDPDPSDETAIETGNPTKRTKGWFWS